MARERLIKAKFFRSEDIAVLPFEGRLLFQSMWCHADRMGTLKYSPRLLKADTFPFDDVTAQQIEDLVSLMERHGMVKTFTHDGVDYLRVVSFSKYQKPHPREPQSWPFLTDSGEVTAKPEPVSDKPRQSRNKKPSGKAFPSLSSSPSFPSLRKKGGGTLQPTDAFNFFWELYPRKEGKADAIKAWHQVNGEYHIGEIEQALYWQVACKGWVKDDGQYIPLPASYLRGKRWEDEYQPPPAQERREGGSWDFTEAEAEAIMGPYEVQR